MTTLPSGQRLVGENSIEKFDQDYINDGALDRLLEKVLSTRHAIREIADFGGGNGRLLDRLLQRMPDARGTNYEISKHLRELNAPSDRKTVVADSFLSIKAEAKFDLIFMNWVLHHLVGADLQSTISLINAASAIAHRALKPGGILVVSENLLQSVFPARFASAALFEITRSRLLKPLVSRMRDGKAIAGVGIYYLSEPQLHSLFPGFRRVGSLVQGDHDYGWKIRLIGITRVTEKILIFQKAA